VAVIVMCWRHENSNKSTSSSTQIAAASTTYTVTYNVVGSSAYGDITYRPRAPHWYSETTKHLH